MPGTGTGPRLGGALDAGTTRVEPAVPAFKDPPVRTRVAQVARPLDQGVVQLDHDKRVRAVAGECHLECCSSVSLAPGTVVRWIPVKPITSQSSYRIVKLVDYRSLGYRILLPGECDR